MKYLGNTLQSAFGLKPEEHEDFSRLFKENCKYLSIGSGITLKTPAKGSDAVQPPSVVTVAEPDSKSNLTAFVILPFHEREATRPTGFFKEVLQSLITPAARNAGFFVKTANRQGSDVIQSSIINDLLEADLVIADLTEHNPNVLFELGVRMAFDKPVALIKAKGTGRIFDVDNMLRVFEYDPNLWRSTLDNDLPNLRDHIKGGWETRDASQTYMKILLRKGAEAKAA